MLNNNKPATDIILALREWKWADQEFKVIYSYVVSSRPARAMLRLHFYHVNLFYFYCCRVYAHVNACEYAHTSHGMCVKGRGIPSGSSLGF